MPSLTNLSYIKELSQKYGFTFEKKFGQNFIINPSVCPRIVDNAGIDENTGVIEIGTGVGVLTAELAKRAKKVVAIEIDTDLKELLKETLGEYDNIEIIFDDVRIPLKDANGRNYNIQQFDREIRQFFRSHGIKVEHVTKNNTLVITIK